jgi:hypothetical protein
MNENGVDVPALLDDAIVAVAANADKKLAAVKRIKSLSFQVTNNHDWVDQNGKPYLQASGGEKIARLFGISWVVDEPTIENLEGGHYLITYTGKFTLGGITIDAMGTRSSKDGFFKKYGPKDEAGNKVELPASEIDKGDVKKSAFTNLIANGITRLLGIRNLTWEELADAGISKDKASSVEYGTSRTERTGKITEPQRKRFYAIAKGSKWSDEEIKVYLKNVLKIETANDLLVADYDKACAWASLKEGQEYAG